MVLQRRQDRSDLNTNMYKSIKALYKSDINHNDLQYIVSAVKALYIENVNSPGAGDTFDDLHSSSRAAANKELEEAKHRRKLDKVGLLIIVLAVTALSLLLAL